MITSDKVDGIAINSTNHGDADFVELFAKEVREHGDLLSIKGRKIHSTARSVSCQNKGKIHISFSFLMALSTWRL